MSDGVGLGLVERARAAAAGGDWQQAFDLLIGADADGLLGPADLPVLGEVAYAAGHLDVAIEAWERAHAACIQAGDQLAAAGRGSPRGDAPALRHRADGTRQRLVGSAERLLNGRGETPSAHVVRSRPYLRADADRRHARRQAMGPARDRRGYDM